MKRTLTFLFTLCMLTACLAQPRLYHSFNNLGGLTEKLCIRSIAQSSDGMMWLGAEDGLYSYDGYHLQKRTMDTPEEKEPSVGSVNCMVADGDSIMIGFEKGLWSFNLHTYTFRQLDYAKGENVKAIVRLQGCWWVASERSVYKDGVELVTHVDNIFTMNGTGSDLYIGTRDAVYHHTPQNLNQPWRQMAKGLAIVTKLQPQPEQGLLWVGTAHNVMALDKQGNLVFEQEMPVVKSLCSDQQGNLLVGTDNGLFIVSKNREVHHLLHDARMEQSLAGDAVWSLFPDREANIWVGTNSGISMAAKGLAKRTYTLPSITGEGAGNQLFCIVRDAQERLWMGGSNGLLYIKDLGRDSQTYKWYRMGDPQNPLPHNRIRVILPDRKQRLWVGCDGGLLLLNEATGQFERYEITSDSRNWVYDIEETDGDELVVTTFDATYRVLPHTETKTMTTKKKLKRKSIFRQQEECEALCHTWGLTGNYFSASLDKKTNTLMLGGTDSFTLIETKKTERSTEQPHTVITDIRVNGTRLLPHEAVQSASATFRPDERVLQFFFSDFDYTGEKPDNYSYRIGRQGDWIPLPPESKSITLTQLEAGAHQLYIRNSIQQQADEGEPRPIFSFTIQAPWYATTLAKVCYALLLAAILYGIYLYVQQRQRLRKAQAERTQLLAQAKQKEKKLLSDNEYLASQLRMRLIEKSGEANELSGDEKFLLDITRIIEENMDDSELNVNTLSEKSGIGTKQLYRRIKAITGMTTVAYIRDQRLKKAASLLAKGSFTVSEVMYMVGFSSASYFTRCFCDEYGVPPSEYKK